MSDLPSRTYGQPAKVVFDAAVRAVHAAGHQVEDVDEAVGLLNFSSRTNPFEAIVTKDEGQTMSILVRDNGAGATSVQISGEPRNRWQWGSEGSRTKIAHSIFDAMDSILAGVR